MNNSEPTTKLDNPNRTRDHLSNERTYLAWIRTAIALMGFGVVIVRLRDGAPQTSNLVGEGWQLGLLFAAVGLMMVVFATAHYFEVLRAIESASYEPKRRIILLCSFLILVIGATVIFNLISNPPSATTTILAP